MDQKLLKMVIDFVYTHLIRLRFCAHSLDQLTLK
jgi:hypothetical protein